MSIEADFYPVLKAEGGKIAIKYYDEDEIGDLEKMTTSEGNLSQIITNREDGEDVSACYKAYYRTPNRTWRIYQCDESMGRFIGGIKKACTAGRYVVVVKFSTDGPKVPLIINSDDPIIEKLATHM